MWAQECKDLPMKGLWVESNAQMFSYSVGFYGKSKQAASKFSFAASSPHYLPGGTELNPARFNMFIPDSYVTSIGYTADTFNISALKLTVADAQVAQPTLTRRAGGFGLDFGIAHYSSPNPELEFLNSNWTEAEAPLTSSTSSNTATKVAAPVAKISRSITSKTKRTLSGTSLAKSAGLALPKKAKITLSMSKKYAKQCKLSTTSVRTLKKGKCVVKVTVVTTVKKKTKKTSKNVTVVVK